MSNSFNPPAEFLFLQARRQKFPWVNVALFGLTCISTMIVGAVLMEAYTNSLGDVPSFLSEIFRSPSVLLTGIPFSLAIMTILLAHEMGHYLTCRYYGIDATLPYFIPFPSIVGTMGAFIRIKSPFRNRAELLEVGIGGPIAGFVLAVPTLIFALTKSSGFIAPEASFFGLERGDPLIFKLLEFVMGKTPPAGMIVHLHPIGFAAWFGFFATALNLLPVGQLDGGHVLYALFRGTHRRISRVLLFTLIPLGLFYWWGWLIWTTVLLFIGSGHPMTLDDSIPLKTRHTALGWIALAMFVLCFTPIPFYLS
jgi:membrane-associated protease RseP (regulator of RpoE activity)